MSIRARKCLLFDLDGTLWDAVDAVVSINNKILLYLGIADDSFTRQDIEAVMGKTRPETVKMILPHLDLSIRQQIIDHYEKKTVGRVIEHNPLLYPHAREVLVDLKATHRLFIVSNCEFGYIEDFLRWSSLTSVFSGWECYGRTHLPKSDSILQLCQRTRIDPEDCLYVGDTAGDEQAARLAGVPFVHASYGFGQVSSCDWTVANFLELRDLLRK